MHLSQFYPRLLEVGLVIRAWFSFNKKRKNVAQDPEVFEKVLNIFRKKHFRKKCPIEMQIRQPRWTFLAKKTNELFVKVSKALRKTFFFHLFSPPTWESALNLPARIFCRKAENFTLCVWQGLKKIWNFEKFSRLFPCGSHYSSGLWNCLNGQKFFNSDTPAERLWLNSWKISPTLNFFPG